MKKYILTDNFWELKRYLSTIKDRWIVEIEPEDPLKISKVKNFLFSYAMMEKPMILIKSVEKWHKEELKWLNNALKKFEGETEVIVISSQAETLKKFGKFDDFTSPKPWEEEKWVEKIKEIGSLLSMKIDDEAAREIFIRVGAKLDLISKELEKLGTISSNVTVDDVAELVPFYVKADLFESTYMILARDKSALDKFKKLLDDSHILVILTNLEKTLILLAQLILMKKKNYSWNDVKDAAKLLNVRTPQIADLVGFSLGKKQRKNLLKSVKFDEVISFLQKVQDIEVEAKNGGNAKFLIEVLVKEWIDGRLSNAAG